MIYIIDRLAELLDRGDPRVSRELTALRDPQARIPQEKVPTLIEPILAVVLDGYPERYKGVLPLVRKASILRRFEMENPEAPKTASTTIKEDLKALEGDDYDLACDALVVITRVCTKPTHGRGSRANH